jgi:CRISPR-associated endonuclease/helicase Cas3
VGEGEKIAHVRPELEGGHAIHLLEDHLRETGRLAGGFASEFGNEDWAHLAGLWHDLGKYKDDFQEYIRRVTGYERDEAEDGGPGKVDHTAAGAIHAMERMGPMGPILGYLIAGHHSGLPDWIKDEATGRGLQERISDRDHMDQALEGKPSEAILQALAPKSLPCGKRMESSEQVHLWIRMLFSCLVDADFLDTEAFMDPDKASLRPAGGDLASLRARYDQFMDDIQVGAPDTPVNRIRRQILADCRNHAAWEPGFFSLTVPTGGGKTLASMGFALDHAIRHGKRRIVVVIPYTSIIEQTAEVLRKVFGDEAVLEHHSNLDPDRETKAAKLATENWDAPIIVTTNVQLFESLFAARTSACRKLHNLTDSVLILDEAQMLPPEYLKPILSGLRGLVENFGVTAVLCTATQPALVGRIGGDKFQNKESFEGLPTGQVRELMTSPESLSRELLRVRVEQHPKGDQACTWEEIATELVASEQVLCIVNTRKDCRALFDLLPEGTIHLSALMCGEHRSEVITGIKAKLKAGQPIRVVSTQLVEAGVDLDFPVVYRALAGLDSIAQAAGRCNREGKLSRPGQVVVFAPPKAAPTGLLRKGEEATKAMLRTRPELVEALSPEAFRTYFETFYGKVNSFDTKDILTLLAGSDAQKFQIQFRTAAQRFRLIDDSAQKSIVVWFEGKRFDSRELLEELRKFGPHRRLMRRLQRCTVTVPERAWKELLDQGAIQELVGADGKGLGIWGQCVPDLYDRTFGLRLEGPVFQGDEFIC